MLSQKRCGSAQICPEHSNLFFEATPVLFQTFSTIRSSPSYSSLFDFQETGTYPPTRPCPCRTSITNPISVSLAPTANS